MVRRGARSKQKGHEEYLDKVVVGDVFLIAPAASLCRNKGWGGTLKRT